MAYNGIGIDATITISNLRRKLGEVSKHAQLLDREIQRAYEIIEYYRAKLAERDESILALKCLLQAERDNMRALESAQEAANYGQIETTFVYR